jgi:mono/diheme cytochrome c family protein
MRMDKSTRNIVAGALLAAVALGLVFFLASCGEEGETSPEVTLGETIYVEGTNGQGDRITRTTEMGVLGQAGCRSCHGEDAEGRSIHTALGDYDAPDIRWSVISHPFPNDEGGLDPAYDPTTFARAVRDGIDSGGGDLDPVMPHWDLTDQEVDALIAYLQTL